MHRPPRAFTLRLPTNLHACCKHYAKAEGLSLQMWIQRRLEKAVGKDAIVVATYSELSGKIPKSWPELR
jgi:hypothetical protein